MKDDFIRKLARCLTEDPDITLDPIQEGWRENWALRKRAKEIKNLTGRMKKGFDQLEQERTSNWPGQLGDIFRMVHSAKKFGLVSNEDFKNLNNEVIGLINGEQTELSARSVGMLLRVSLWIKKHFAKQQHILGDTQGPDVDGKYSELLIKFAKNPGEFV